MSLRKKGKKQNNPFHIPTDEELFVLREKQALRKTLFPKVEKSVKFAPRMRNQKKKSQKFGTGRIPKETKKKKAENMKEFIEKKRQMFLLQMSLDSKKFEIQKLRQFVGKRQKKLELEEDCLIRDSRRFDDFLTENDISAINAINKAEEEKKKKIEKKKEIFQLRQKVKMIELEIQKVDEQLDDCKIYKGFLDKLTPALLKSMDDEEGDVEKKTKKVEVGKMHFERPEQLLELFSELEQNNLSLMKRANEVEKQLEDAKKSLRETRVIMGKKSADLTGKIEEYTANIEKEREKSKELRKKLKMNEDKNNPMEQLKEVIRDIYNLLGLHESFPNTDMEHLQMLSKIEIGIESLITKIDDYGDPARVHKKIKELDKERRQEKRQQNKRLLQKKKIVEESVNIYYVNEMEHLDRIPRRPLMIRSVPPEIKKRVVRKKVVEKNDGFFELFGS